MTRLVAERAAELDRWFFRRGLSSMLDDTPIRVEASRRATPFLVVWFALVMLIGVPATTGNILISALIGIAALLAVWVGANLLRRRKPFSPVARFGWPEGVAFVLVPALAALVSPHEGLVLEDITITSLQARMASTVVLLVLQGLVLALALAFVKFGVISLAGWLLRELFATFATTGVSLARTLPLLMGVVAFFYFTGELWQSVGRLDSLAYLGVIALFVGLSLAFLSSRGGVEVENLARFEDPATLGEALAAGPLHDVELKAPAVCPLTRRQRRNLRLLSTISRLLVATLVGVAVFVFFLALGALAVNGATVKAFTGADPQVIIEWATAVHTYALTWEQVRVAGFLAVFAGFYYAVVSATDPAMRQGVRDTVTESIREACATRAALLAITAGGEGGSKTAR